MTHGIKQHSRIILGEDPSSSMAAPPPAGGSAEWENTLDAFAPVPAAGQTDWLDLPAQAPAAAPLAPPAAPGAAPQWAPAAPTPGWGDMSGGAIGGGGVPVTAQAAAADPDFMDIRGAIRQAKHPVAAAFHLLFKLAAMFVYFFGAWMNFILAFVLCVLLLAFDFWTVKNVTGRLLVGLRWWNNIQEDGTSKYVFESIEDPSAIGNMDKRIFWWGLWLTPGVWSIFAFIGLLKLELEWLIVCSVALMLNAAQVYGYTKCSKEASAKLGNLAGTASSAANFIYSPLGQAMVGQSMKSAAAAATGV